MIEGGASHPGGRRGEGANRARSLAWSLAALAAAALAAQLLSPWSIRVNRTDSMPSGIYLVSRGERARVGDAAVLTPPPLALAHGCAPNRSVPLLKVVRAVEGGRVCMRGRTLHLGGAPFSTLPERDARGRPIRPALSGCAEVPEGHVWVATRAPRSCDSRVYGFVPESSILGRARPLYAFGG